MGLKSFVFLCSILFIFASCNNFSSNEIPQKGESKDTLIQDKTSSNPDNNGKGTFELESYHNQEVIATYQSASVFAVETHYHFETEKGQEILVIESTDDESKVKLPKNMLEELEEGKRFPDANPKFIGNLFTLYFNENGKVYKVLPVKL